MKHVRRKLLKIGEIKISFLLRIVLFSSFILINQNTLAQADTVTFSISNTLQGSAGDTLDVPIRLDRRHSHL
jgi:hypothetical protein